MRYPIIVHIFHINFNESTAPFITSHGITHTHTHIIFVIKKSYLHTLENHPLFPKYIYKDITFYCT